MTRPTTTKRRAAAPAPHAPVKTKAAAAGRRIQVKRSGVHGKGVFAVQPIAAGETIIEYVGEIISWEEAQRRHPHDLCDPNHTFYFHIDGDHVIDALFEGNASKWINHACDPNCESDERDGRIFIQAVRDIAAGEELNYDYGLVLDERYTAKLKAEYACHCGAPDCRRTMLAPKRGVKLADRPAKPEAAKAAEPKAKASTKPQVKQAAQKAKPEPATQVKAKAKATSTGKGKAADAKTSSTSAKPVRKAGTPGKPTQAKAVSKTNQPKAKAQTGAKASASAKPKAQAKAVTAPKASKAGQTAQVSKSTPPAKAAKAAKAAQAAKAVKATQTAKTVKRAQPSPRAKAVTRSGKAGKSAA